MKLFLYRRFLGIGLTLLASAAMGQALTPITSWSTNNNGQWFNYANWSNGFVNGAGSVAWINSDFTPSRSIADFVQTTPAPTTTAALTVQLNAAPGGALPIPSSIGVTDGTFFWSLSKGSTSAAAFIVNYVPGASSLTVAYNPAVSGRTLTISYAAQASGAITELVGTTDGTTLTFNKTLTADPALTSGSILAVTDGRYNWDSSSNTSTDSTIPDGDNTTHDFMVSYVVATRQLTVSYSSGSVSVLTQAGSTPTPRIIKALYNAKTSAGTGVTLGTLGIGDQSGTDVANLRLHSLTFNNNGALAQLDKIIGSASDEVASGIHLFNPLALDVRTTGDFTSSLRISGNIDGPNGIVKMDTGNATLSGDNTFTGSTIVRDTSGTIYLRSGLVLENCITTTGTNSNIVTCYSTTGLEVGMAVSGTATSSAIQPGTVVTGITPGGSPGAMTFTISPGATIAASNQTFTAKSTSGVTLANCFATAGNATVSVGTATSPGSVAGLAVGMTVTGTSMPQRAVVTAINSTATPPTFTINSAAPATSGNVTTGETIIATAVNRVNLTTTLNPASTTLGSAIVTVPTVAGLVVGAPVTGGNIPTGTTILAINTGNQQITLSAAATSTSSVSLKVGCSTTVGGTTVTCVNTVNVTPGMTITGVNIPSGTMVQSITDNTHFVINLPCPAAGTGLTLLAQSPAGLPLTNCAMDPGTGTPYIGCATAVGQTIVTCSSTAGLVAGMSLTGPNLPPNAVVANPIVPGTSTISPSFNLNTPATATGTGLTLMARSVPAINLSVTLTNCSNTIGNTKLTCPSTVGITAGASITGPYIPAGTTVFGTPPNSSTIIMSQAAADTGSTQGTVYTGLTIVIGGTTTSGSAVVSCADSTNVAVGMAVSGPNIPTGATVASVSPPLSLTLNVPVLIGEAGQAVIAAAASSNTQISCTSVAGLAPGMAVNGPNMPNGAYITSVNTGSNTFTLNTEPLRAANGVLLIATSGGDVTLTGAGTISGSAAVTCASTQGMVLGMVVTMMQVPGAVADSPIQGSATVHSITNGTTFVMSIPATFTATGLTLAAGTNSISSSQIYLGTAARDGNASSTVIQLSASNQINDSAVIYFDAASSRNSYLRTEGFNETIAGINNDDANGVVENSESENGIFRSSTLTINNSSDFSYSGYVRNKSSGDSTGILNLVKGGTGVQTLSGGNVTYSGDTTVVAGTLRILNATAWASNVTTRQAANVELATVASDWQFNSPIVGAGGLNKTGPNMVTVIADTTFSGPTTISGGGTLRLNSNVFTQSVASSSATSYSITLSRSPAPGSIFVLDGAVGATGVSTWTEPDSGFGATGGLGQPPRGAAGGAGKISGVTFNPATKVLTITYSPAPGAGKTITVNYQQGDSERIGNTDGVDKVFGGTLISVPRGATPLPLTVAEMNASTLQVTDGTDYWISAAAASTLTGNVISGTSVGGTFTVTYDATVRLVTVTYATAPAYGKAITAIWSADEGLNSTSSINLNNGIFTINNSSPQNGSRLNLLDRVNNNAPVNSNGGTINFTNSGASFGGDSFTETLGTLNLLGGLTTINGSHAATKSALTFTGLGHADGAGSAVLFSGPGLGRDSTNTVLFSTPPSLGATNGHLIGGWAVEVNGTAYDFATYGGNGITDVGSSLAQGNRTTAIASWTALTDAMIKSAPVASKNTVVNSILFNDATSRALTINGRTLTVTSGGIIFSNATAPSIVGTTVGSGLTGSTVPGTSGASGGELDLWTSINTMSAVISAPIINGSAGTSTTNGGLVVVKAGPGEVKFTGANSYTGGTRVYGGDLDVGSIGGLGLLKDVNAPKADFLTLNGGTIQVSASTNAQGQTTSPVLNFGSFPTPALPLGNSSYGIVLGPAGGSFALDPTATVNIASPVTGPGGLTVGSKTVFSTGGFINILSNNTFQGTVNAISGTMSFNGGSNTFTGGFTTGTSGTIIIHNSASIPANNTVTMAGGNFVLGSSLTIGALTAPVGSVITLQPNPLQNAPSDNTTVLNAGQPILLTINQNTNTTFAGTITDTVADADSNGSPVFLGIEKRGAGVLTLTQSLGDILSDYRGVTKISEGVLATTLLGNRGLASAIGSGGGQGSFPGDLPRDQGSASLLYIENGAGLSYVGTNPTFTNRPFTIGVGALGAAIYANGSGLGNTVDMIQGTLFTTDPTDSFTTLDLAPDAIGFSRPNEAATLVLGGRNLGDNIFAMDLHDNGTAPLSLQKSGDGNWVLGTPMPANITLTHCTVGYKPTGNDVVTTDDRRVVTCDSTAGLVLGMFVTGPHIRPETTVDTIASDGTTFLLSQPAASATDVVGPETVTLTAVGDSFNDFTGGTTIYLGTLAIQQNGVLGAAGGPPVQLIGGNLDLRNVAYTRSETLSMDGGRLRSIIGSSSWAGPLVVDVPSTIEVDTGSLLDLQGGISGRGSVTKVGSGTIELEGSNTFIGAMTVSEGGLMLNYTNNQSSKLADNATLTLGGGRTGATVTLVGNSPVVEAVGSLSLQLGLNRIMGSKGGPTMRFSNTIAIALGATLDVETFSDGTSSAATIRANEGNGILGPWLTTTSSTGVSDWAANSNTATGGGLGNIIAYPSASYKQDTWSGSTANVNVTTNLQTTFQATLMAEPSNPPGSSTYPNPGQLDMIRLSTTPSVPLSQGNGVSDISGSNAYIVAGTAVLKAVNSTDYVLTSPVTAPEGTVFTVTFQLSANTLRYATSAPTIIQLAGNNFLNDGGILQSPSAGAVNNIITGGTLQLGNNAQGGNLVLAQYDALGDVQVASTVANAPDIVYPASPTYSSNVTNRIALQFVNSAGLNVNNFYNGMLVTGPNVRPNSTINGISTNIYTITQNIATALAFGQGAAGSAPALPSYTVTTQADGVVNEIRLSSTPVLPLVVGELVTDTNGFIPPNTVVTTVINATDYILSNNLPTAATNVSVTVSPWGELAVGNAFVQTTIGGNTGYQVHLSVGTLAAFGIVKEQTVSAVVPPWYSQSNPPYPTYLGIPAGAKVLDVVPGSTTDFYIYFPQSRNLTINGNPNFVGNIAVGSNGTQVHLTTGTTAGLAVNQIVTGTDIQPAVQGGTQIGSIVNTTDFTLNVSVFAPVVQITVSGRNGLLKTGAGDAQVTGANTFTGPVTITGGTLSVPQITNGGVVGPLGASSSAATNITIGGSTLQYTGNNATVDRGFTINSQGSIDVANKGVTLTFTGNLSGGVGAALGILQKEGAGTLALSRSITLGGATNFGGFQVDNGTLQLVYTDANDSAASTNVPALDKFAAAANNATLTLGGGKFEFVGVATAPVLSGTDYTEDRTQDLLGQLTLNTGASQIWVTSQTGSNTTLNLQNSLAPSDVLRQPGATVLFVENPNGGNSANITVAVNSIDQAVPLTWATYWDTSFVSQPGVNNFAALEPADDGVISADSKRLYTTTSDVSSWGSGETDSESGTPFSGFTQQGLEIYAMRFFAQATGVVNITDNLTLDGGAILNGTNVGNHPKFILGGEITSGLRDQTVKQDDFIIHNYNPAAPLQISSQIEDNRFDSGVDKVNTPVNLTITGTGTTWLTGTNTYTGPTYLTGGVLRLGSGAALPGGILYSSTAPSVASNLVLDGGVLGISSNFTRSLGTGANQVQFTGSGGFAAYGSDATVTFGGTASTLVWGAGSFVPDSSELMFSANDATNTITLTNPINLGGFGRVIDVADGAAAVDAILSGGLSGNGGSIRKTGQGVLRLTGGQGTQTGGAVIAQGTLSTSASSLGTGPLGLGTTDNSNTTDAITLELRGGSFSSVVTVGNTNSTGITTISATSSPTLNGALVLNRDIFFAPQTGRKITINGGISGSGGFTVLGGGVVALNGAGTFPGLAGSAGTTSGPAVDGAATIRSGALYLGSSGALGQANVELGDTAVNAPISVDRTTAGRSVLLQGGAYDPRSAGRPGTNNGRGGFLFQNQINLVIDGRTYTQSDSLLDGSIVNDPLHHKRTLILVNGEETSPDRNGIYEIVYALGDSFTVDGCTTSLLQSTLLNATTTRSQTKVTLSGNSNTQGLLVGMTVISPNVASGTTIASIQDNSTIILSQVAVGTGTSNWQLTIGSETITTLDSSALVIGMPISGKNIPANATVASIVDDQTFTIDQRVTGAGTGLTLTARSGDSIGLNRIAEFQQDSQMKYGTRVLVKDDGTGASDAGKTFFLGADVHVTYGVLTLTNGATTAGNTAVTCANTSGLVFGMQVTDSPDGNPANNINLQPFATVMGVFDSKTFIVNLASASTASGLTMQAIPNPPIPQFSPTWWVVDTLNPNVSLLATAANLTIANSIDVNEPTGTGVTSLGGSPTLNAGSTTFSGNVTLQNVARTLTGCVMTTGSTSVTCDTTGFLVPGMTLSGTGVAAGTKVVSITSATSFVISPAAIGIVAAGTLGVNINTTVRLLSDTLDPGGVIFTGVFSEASNTGDYLSLQKLGTGVVTLTGTNTYSGGTSVQSGSLFVDNVGAGSGTGSGPVNVTNVGTLLGGKGSIGGLTTVTGGAILSPGDPRFGTVGSLNFQSGLTLGKGAVVNLDLASDLDFDRVTVAGLLYVDPAAVINVMLDYNPVFVSPTQSPIVYDLLDWGSISGSLLADLVLPSLVDNYFYWDTSLFDSQGIISLAPRGTNTPPVARFAVSAARVQEASVAVNVAVELDVPATVDTTISLLLGGTATQGLDYDLASPTSSIIVKAGKSSADVTILVHDDAISEPTETVVLTFAPPVPTNAFLVGTPSSFTLSILDNDSSVPMGVTWKVRNPLPTNESLRGITQLGSTLVAVGTAGTLLTSTNNGTSWTPVALGINPALSSVASTPNITPAASPAVPMIVAVGDNGNIVTSPDGVSWTYRNVSGNRNLRGVVWADALSLFVAVGDQGVIYTSPDGVSWTHQVSFVSADLEAVTFASSTLVAVGKTGTILYSADGVNWSAAATSVTAAWLRGVAYNPSGSVFAAVGDGGVLVTSPDGSSWTAQAGGVSGTAANLKAVYSDGSRFIVAGAAGALYYSSTGTSWTSAAVAGVTTDLLAGSAISSGSIVVGAAGVILTAPTNSTTFTKSPASTGTVGSFADVAFAATGFVAVGQGGLVATAPATGTINNWTTLKIGSANLTAVAARTSPNQIVAVGEGGALIYSSDGTNWSTGTSGVSPSLRGIVFSGANSTYYVVGDQGTLLTSTTGTTWTSATLTSENLYGIASSGSLLVAVGADGTILTSPDGVTWEDVSPGSLPTLTGIVWTGSQYIITGVNGTLLTTPDGVNLTQQTSFTAGNLNSVVWSGTTAYAVGDNGVIISSSDGVTWTVQDSRTTQNLTGIACNVSGQRLTAVGALGSIVTSDPVIVPTPSVYFASTSTTVDDLVGTVSLPVTVAGIPNTDLHITVSVGTVSGVPATACTVTTPFVIKSSSITSAEVAAGMFTRQMPVKLAVNAIKGNVTIPIRLVGVGSTPVAGKPAIPDNAVIYTPSQFNLSVTPGVKPTIGLTAPANPNQMVPVGGSFTLTAAPAGSTYTVQWLKNGVAVPLATSNTYTVAAATIANAGKYTAKVTNALGTSLTTTGLTAPAGTAEISVVDESDKTVLVKTGASTVFTATAAGDGLTYAWFKAGTPITSTTLPSKYTVATSKLTVKTVNGSDEGQYYCVVTQTTPNTGLSHATGNFSLFVAGVPDVVVPSSPPEGRVGAAYALPITRAGVDPRMSPTTYVATGLPTGLTMNATTGVISGVPTVAGTFKSVKVTATNAAGSKILSLFTIIIDPIDPNALGAFVGFVDRSGAVTTGTAINGTLGLGARFDLTTTATSAYSGKLTMGTLAYAFSGKLSTSAVGDAVQHNPQGVVTIARAGKSAVTVAFSIDPATNLLAGTVTGTGTDTTTANITGWRSSWRTTAPANPAAVAGLHTFIADVMGGPLSNGTQPEGSSYGSLTITTAGVTTIVGKTADGSALATTSFMGPTGQVLLYQSLYTIQGSFCGILNVDLGTSQPNESFIQQMSGSLSWSHPAQTAATYRAYKAGWPLAPISLGVDGGLYYPAHYVTSVDSQTKVVTYIITLPMNLPDNTATGDPTNAKLVFEGGGIGVSVMDPDLPGIQVKTLPKAVASVIIPANATKTTLTINNATGTFTGTFTLTDADPTSLPAPAKAKPNVVRTVTFQGIIIPDQVANQTNSDVLYGVGYGYYLLPQLPANASGSTPATTIATSPILSGLVTFEHK